MAGADPRVAIMGGGANADDGPLRLPRTGWRTTTRVLTTPALAGRHRASRGIAVVVDRSGDFRPMLFMQGREQEYGHPRTARAPRDRCQGVVSPLLLNRCGRSSSRTGSLGARLERASRGACARLAASRPARRSTRWRKMRMPVAGDVDAAAEPNTIMRAHIFQQPDQSSHPPGPPDQPVVHADRKELRCSSHALAIKHVEGIAHVGEEIVAGREPAVLVETI